MSKRISRLVASEIRAGFAFAEILYATSGMDTHGSVRLLASENFAAEYPGPYVRAARRRYARLVLRSRHAD